MKKFNLFNEIIVANKPQLEDAIKSQKHFCIDTKGDVLYNCDETNLPLIYSATPKETQNIQNALGRNYQVVEDEERVLIKAFSNWQELIKINMPKASYDDTTADGVAEFSNKELEEIGWYADEFNISYREMVEILEEKCSGTLLCIEQEEPYQFSGLGFLADNKEAKDVLFDFCQNKIADMLKNDPDFAPENLTDDEEEAAKFFKLL